MMQPLFTSLELPTIKHPTSLVPKCGLCGLYKTCKSPKMKYTGKGQKSILIVGEAPGEDEDKEGKQFVGKSGELLTKTLRKLGVDPRRDCWLTNALICRPPKNQISDDKMVDYCRPNLMKTIAELEPNVIILLGGTACQSLITEMSGREVESVTQWVGWQIPGRNPNCWVCPTFHPSYLLRVKDPVLDLLFEEHLGKAVIKSKAKPWQKPVRYEDNVRIIYDPEQVYYEVEEMIDAGGLAAFDYETNMLKPDSDKAQIVTCSICCNGTTIAYPWVGKAIEATKMLLLSPLGKIASNMKFEDRWTTKHLKIKIKNWVWDTALAAHVMDNRPGITSIKFQAFVHLGQPDYDSQIKPYLQSVEDGGNSPNRIRQADMRSLLLYNGMDSLLEYEVAKIQAEQMGIDLEGRCK